MTQLEARRKRTARCAVLNTEEHWQVSRLHDLMKGCVPFLTCMISHNGKKKERGDTKMVLDYQLDLYNKFRTL